MKRLKPHQTPLILKRRMVAWWVMAVLAATVTPEAFSAPGPATPPGSFAQLVKIASPAVVNISTVKTVKDQQQAPSPFGPDDPFRDLFERFFGGQIPKEYKQKSLGTGLIISPDGFILTNNHVVEQSDEIKVKTADDKEFIAEIIGRDPMTDLALIHIEAAGPLMPLVLGDSDRVEVGDWVVAIGNPFGLGNTVTAGIVSAKYRQIGAGSYENFIQTDTPINPGNSGGPLLNTSGEVIGINTAIFSQSGGSVGIGFAIPVNIAKDLLPQLKKGKIVRGWIGVMMQKITPELKDKLNLIDEKGALVSDVVVQGPVDEAGIKRGDVIVAFNGKEIKEMHELPYIVASAAVGQTVVVDIIRKREKKSVQVKVGELKPATEEAQPGAEGELGLGITLKEVTPELAQQYDLTVTRGIIIVDVESNSPADEADLRSGDIILEVDQLPMKTIEAFVRKVRQYRQGDTVLILINREGSTLFMTLAIP